MPSQICISETQGIKCFLATTPTQPVGSQLPDQGLNPENSQGMIFKCKYVSNKASLMAQMVKNLPVMWEIPGSGRCPGEGNGNPFQYSCLENPMGRGAWWATVHGLAKSQTRLSS